MKKLHSKQQKILKLLKENIDNPLTIKNLREQVGIESPGVLYHHLSQLEKKGYLKRNPHNSKDYVVLDSPENTVVYIGKRFAGWNTDVVKTKPVEYRIRIFSVDSYTTIDLTAGYTYKKISFLAKVSNLTNTLNYYVHENYSINPIPPTQFLATISYRL